jgi:23S rRNA (uracil1939-C5)-methyltransferase
MTNARLTKLEEVQITKLVYGGRGLGELPNGKKIFVWNALPGELVSVRLIKSRRAYDEGIAEKIIKVSADREILLEPTYLSTSPWQMMSFAAENRYKKDITRELLLNQKVVVSSINGPTYDQRLWHYRNKMEYSFVDYENKIHLALHERSSHNLSVIGGSNLAIPALDMVANNICILLSKTGVKAKDLKSVIVRCTQNKRLAASLFVLNKSFPYLELPKELNGLRVHHSQPTSYNSVQTKKLYEVGDCTLEDELLNHKLIYDVDSFFQINLPVFELALERIKTYCQSTEIVDMYAGVGSIGLNVASSNVDLVELNPDMAVMARKNAERLKVKALVIEASTDNALEYIVPNKTIIFDPPRSGLHAKIISKILEVRPYRIAYLSCNPSTQARDLYWLQSAYNITYFEVFNFFPRTPEIETLAILDAK